MSGYLLAVEDLDAFYGSSHVVQGVSFALAPAEVLTLLGRNGAGKTTVLKALMGIVPERRGRILFDGADLALLPPQLIARSGIGYVPETRAIFPSLTVLENLTVAARPGNWTLDRIFALFPRLAERRRIGGGRLSGGEQQMLSIARALMTNPRLLLLDEPTEGLAPTVVDEIEAALTALKRDGMAILLVEQNLAFALAFADEAVVLGKGQVRWRGRPAALAEAAEAQSWLAL